MMYYVGKGRRALPQEISMPSCFSCAQLFEILWTAPARLLYRWDSPGKNTGVGCHVLLQGIFPIQGSKLDLQVDSLPLSHQGSPENKQEKLKTSKIRARIIVKRICENTRVLVLLKIKQDDNMGVFCHVKNST